MPDDYMTRDQRFAGRRPDVLVYQTEPLASDVTIAGPIGVDLWVSTSGTDSDFVVKLIDAYPADYPDPDPDDDAADGRLTSSWCAASRSAPSSATASPSRSR